MQKRWSGRVRVALAVLLGVAVLVAGYPMSREAAAQAQFKLKMQATWPAGLTLYENFTLFAERVNKMTGGRVEIETLPAGAIVPAFEVLDASSRGLIDGHHGWAGYWVGKNRAAILFTGGPGGTFGMDFIDAMGWMYEGGGLELYQEMYDDVLNLNVVVLPILPSGPQAFGWFKRPIKSLEDFKGMKCRETGLANEIFTEMGMKAVNMPGGEILPAAERGVIDCAEWVGGVEDLRQGFHTIWKYHYVPGMHEPVTIGEVVFNRDVWEKFPEDIKEIIKGAATETFYRFWAKWQKMNAEAIKELTEKHGVQILRTPDEVLTNFLETWDRMAKKWSEENPFFKKVLESQRQYASLVVPAKRFLFPPYNFAADYYWPEKK